jgi:hypothetical protein
MGSRSVAREPGSSSLLTRKLLEDIDALLDESTAPSFEVLH